MPTNPNKTTPLQGLYAITRDSNGNLTQLLSEVDAALQGGAALVQYRNKMATSDQRLQEAQALAALCLQYQTPLIINDDISLAATVQAQGVHLGKHDANIEQARQQLGAAAIIGISCYNQLERAILAESKGASYVAFGSFYPSSTKPDAVRADILLLQQWQNHSIPACAIGGITPIRGTELLANGANILAVINDLWSTDDIQNRASEYARLWR